ncbi:hypothetical protein MUK42_25297 [Musa troglodytarum]|uniref:Arabinogalactan peptide 22 n=1 Tax=Musa troglodytarum TaxID=320322 RepID=A0A9E7JAH1_9LILI|nr:hypothetical protein MUK42_25297 [Musa troglodytarum]
MASLKIHAFLLAYALLAVLLHPCLCQDIATSTMTSPRRFDGKALDQGIAYVLMLLALFVTYLVH